MCHRIATVPLSKLEASLKKLSRGEHEETAVQSDTSSDEGFEAYPGSTVPLFVPDSAGELAIVSLIWGFQQDKSSRLVFNTRIETARDQALRGSALRESGLWGHGLWARAINEGRCLVPARAFYEWWTKPDAQAPRRPDGSVSRRQVRFSLTGHRYFLMAGVYEDDRFSVVTTEPNAAVGAVHSRMPLVLGPGESSVWLHGDWASLADRSSISLDAVVE